MSQKSGSRGPGPAGANEGSPDHQMIKIISYVVIAFCYRKANILQRWSNILHIFSGNKGLCQYSVTAADLIDSDENLHCFLLTLSSCNIKISVVSQCRSTAGILWLFKISTHSLSRFFNRLTTCTYWTEQ